jgi:leucyl aminopeptidase
MLNWSLTSNESLELSIEDALLVLGQEGTPSGELPGGSYAVLRHRIVASLAKQKDGRLEGGEWIESEGERGRAWVQGVSAKPGLDGDECLRIAASEAFAAAMKRKPARIVVLCDQMPAERTALLLEGIWNSNYRFDLYKSKKATAVPEVVFCGKADTAVLARTKLEAAAQVLAGIDLARNLVNEPGSVLTPKEYLARIEAAFKATGIKVKVKTRAQLEKEGYQGIVTVGKGSHNEPMLVTLEYRPKNPVAGRHLALVGKGITFDTGGISLKPGDKMWEMKCDMAGSAVVVGALLALNQLQVPLAITGILCLAENRPGEGSVLPGDIFTARNGKTVMVDNTDAEGRLVLTDGLYEAGVVGATHVIDLATLTGSIVRALGPSIAGIFANNDALAQLLKNCGSKAGEKFWQMPMDAEYRERLDDSTADMKNIGGADAGSITAALFLKEFLPDNVEWAHIDIAGPAFITKSWKYFREGGTGFGVPTLVECAKRLAAS